MHPILRLAKRSERAHVAAQRMFPPATLAAIGALIADSASHHRAEIKIIIDTAPCRVSNSAPRVLPGQHAPHPARARAAQLFAEYRIWDTEQNCGVLLYINVTDRKVEIVADRDVNRALQLADWHGVCKILTEGFKRGQFADSVMAALHCLHGLLQAHYPATKAEHTRSAESPIVL